MRSLFRLPEFLLILAMLAAPVIVGNTSFDIQLDDTYFVFGKTSWGINEIFLPVILLLLLTWVMHLLARKYRWLSPQLRWVQIALTFVFLSIAVWVMSGPLFAGGGQNGFENFSLAAFERYQSLGRVLVWAIGLFVLTQAIFWLTAIIACIASLWRRRRNTT